MIFKNLRSGDWFSINGKPCMRLDECIMSLANEDFGRIHPLLPDDEVVEYLSSFHYEMVDFLADASHYKKGKMSAKDVPYYALFEDIACGSLYVKIPSFHTDDPDLVLVSGSPISQGMMVYSYHHVWPVQMVDDIIVKLCEDPSYVSS